MYRDNVNSLRTLYDVQQVLKAFGTYVYVGKREWDIEVMALELDRLYQMNAIDKPTWLQAKIVLTHEHRIEEEKAKKADEH